MSHRGTQLQPHVISDRQTIDGSVVKSAARVLQILELFEDVRRPVSVQEVADALGYPQSSTSVLMRSIWKMGYLSYDSSKRTYCISERVPLLGHWMANPFVLDGPIIGLMQGLNDLTGDAVILAMKNGNSAQYINVIQAPDRRRPHVAVGSLRPLPASSAGHVLLSQMPKADIIKVITRHNALSAAEKSVSVKSCLDNIESLRRKGYALTQNHIRVGLGSISVPLPGLGPRSACFALGIGGAADQLVARQAELGEMLVNAVRQHFSTTH